MTNPKFPLPTPVHPYARYNRKQLRTLPEMRLVNAELGATLRTLRQKRGWTQAQLATRLHISPNLLRRYEQGSSDMRVPMLIALCYVFCLTPNQFFPNRFV
jgi:ribosome-binding protein aMBF1 (putative translation factor)